MSLTRTFSLSRRSLSYSAPRPDAAAGLPVSMGLRLGKWLTRPEHQHDRTEDPGPIGVQAHDRLHVVVGAQLVREVPDGQRETRKVPDGSNLLTCASPEGQVPCIQQKIDDK